MTQLAKKVSDDDGEEEEEEEEEEEDVKRAFFTCVFFPWETVRARRTVRPLDVAFSHFG